MPTNKNRRSLAIAYLFGLALLLYAVLPQLHAFKSSLNLLQQVAVAPLVAAVACSLLALFAAAAKYWFLALRPVRYSQSLTVQLASLLTNRLLPAGIGGMGVNYIFLLKAKHTKSQATAVVAMNNVLGLVGHMLLVGVLLVKLRSASAPPPMHIHSTAVTIGALAACFGLLLVWHWKTKLWNSLEGFWDSVRSYTRHPAKLLLGTACAVLIALAYALCLWYCAAALQVDLTFIDALIVLTVGVAASTVTPTPGGLVGVEAAMVAGLVAYRLSAADALAVALLYRLVTYWFSMLIGGGALWYAKAQRII